MKNQNKTGVIVLGGHVQGYGIIRIYGENKIPCIIIDTDKFNIAKHSKFCKEFYVCSYQSLLDQLFKLGRQRRYDKWLLIPTDDYYVRLLSQNKKELSEFFYVTVDNWENINLFFNKRNSYPLVEECNVPIPATYYPNTFEDLRTFSDKIKYPCIIKPAIMLDFYCHFKKKVFICNNYNELTENFKKAIEIVKSDEILVQEIIPGNCENQYSVGIFFDRNKSYNYLVGRRKRQHPIDFGNATTFAETVEIPILIEYAQKILIKANYFGICEVEFKFDYRDNKYKFLEVNPRSWKWHLISEGANIPFFLSLFNYFVSGTPIEKKDYVQAGWRDILSDFPIIITMIKRNVFIKAKNKKIINAVFNTNDIKPFIYQILYLPYFIINR